ncbi:MAG: T9SS type A sorting domain-containing protein, partial [Bacteroidetes bacterium]|nr:T9SS type A sorting domain-containing protein [Bacteroidota bacterium]
LMAVSTNKKVQLNWTSAGVGALYAVYKYDTTNKVFNRVNSQLISDTFYTDEQNYFSGNYQYAVFAAEYVSTPSGSYLNRGSGAFAQVNHLNALVQEKPLNLTIEVYPNPVAAGSGLNLNFNSKVKAPILAEWYNLSGSLVKSEEVKDNNLETPQVPQGCYLLKLKMDEQVITKKILIY